MTSTQILKAFASLDVASLSSKKRIAVITAAARAAEISPNQLVNDLRTMRGTSKGELALKNARVCYRAYIA